MRIISRLIAGCFVWFGLQQFWGVSLTAQSPVLTGLDQIEHYQHIFAGKKIGIVANHTAVNRLGEHITGLFLKMPDVQVMALFSPEHGARGLAAAGELIESQESQKNIPFYSLYGATKKPTPEMLKNIDLLVFDMQDIGARFYTYIWTMFYVLQAAAENDIPLVVLDRPNPITGKIEGPLLEKEFASFVGLLPIPVRHGMTVGELATLFNGEGWLGENVHVELTVVPLQNWRREMWFDETGLPFIAPSPNMPNLETAIVYPGLCLLEGTNVSEGRGTDMPFLQFGAPWIDGDLLSEKLNALNLAGIRFEPVSFTPQNMPGKAVHPKYENQRCVGARIRITERGALDAFVSGVQIIKTLHDLYPAKFAFREDGYFDTLCGTEEVRLAMQNGGDLDSLQLKWRQQQAEFKQKIAPYLLYD